VSAFVFGALLTGVGAAVVGVIAVVSWRWMRPNAELNVRRIVALQCVVIMLAGVFLVAAAIMQSWMWAVWAGALVVSFTWSVRNRLRRQDNSIS
jgi:hypothetical protein